MIAWGWLPLYALSCWCNPFFALSLPEEAHVVECWYTRYFEGVVPSGWGFESLHAHDHSESFWAISVAV